MSLICFLMMIQTQFENCVVVFSLIAKAKAIVSVMCMLISFRLNAWDGA
ncbi:hypothetical protein H0G72_05230 [Liberibacter sp. Z1]|nr:hypothetical protein [Candidatus Liberibacter sp.]